MSVILSIDLGTSSVKAILFDTTLAHIIAVASREYPIERPKPNYAEQNPETWWQATVACVRGLMVESGIDKDRVVTIGLAGQMHGTVMLDSDKRVIHPAIIWADQRTSAIGQMMTDAFGLARFVAIARTLPATGFTATTLVWLKQNQPELLDSCAYVILPKDYLCLRLTGEVGTEISDASATGLWDIKNRVWSSEICSAFDLPVDILPRVLDSTAIVGTLLGSVANELGLPAGISVVAGCADQPAQAIGSGLVKSGMASVTIGSGGQVFVPIQATDALQTDSRVHTFVHSVPDMNYVLGAVLSAGLSLRWLRDISGLTDHPNAYAVLSEEAIAIPIGADGLIFLPYLNGERTPHMDANARGTFIGLSLHHGRGHLARAVMEGVTFALREALDICLSGSNPVESLIIAGGGAESPIWRQIQADVFGLPLHKTLQSEQTCVGSALVAGVGVGMYADFVEACAQTAKYDDFTQPNLPNHKRYSEIYDHYRTLYPLLKSHFDWSAHYIS